MPGEVLVGEVLKAHGIRGEVVVRPYSENPARFQPGTRLLVEGHPGELQAMVVASARPQQPGRLLIGFDPPMDRTQAEALRGLRIFAAPEDLPALPEDTYWEHELVGLSVVDVQGRSLGTLTGVLARVEQDLWQVDTPTGPVLLPAAKGMVISVDLGTRRVTVDPPAGLFGEEPS